MTKLDIVRDYLSRQYSNGEEFRFDLLSRKLQQLQSDLTWRNITDKDLNTLACECAHATGANVSDREVRTVLHSRFVADVNPLRDYILSLRPYDPDSGEWIRFAANQVHVLPRDGEDEETAQGEWRYYFRRWFVAMVAGWMSDEVVNHQVLVLIGKQGTGKTTWLEHLMPPSLRSYVTKQASVRELDKDDRTRVAEMGLINMDEIDACSSRELNVLKSLITTTDVNERAAYAHTKERRLRCASFCASGNSREFLSDDTGNRRWLPFEVDSIQHPFDSVLPYDLMYAEAWWLIQNGFRYWLDMDDISMLEQHNQHFKQVHNEEELLPVYFEPCEPGDPNAHFMTATEIHAKLKLYGHIERPMPLNKFGMLLKRCKYPRKVIHGGKAGFIVKPVENQLNRNEKEMNELRSGGEGEGISL